LFGGDAHETVDDDNDEDDDDDNDDDVGGGGRNRSMPGRLRVSVLQ
jgi:hypothetical protein